MKIPPSVWQMNLNKSNEIRNKMKEKIVFFFLFLISFESIKCKNEGLPGILGTREHNISGINLKGTRDMYFQNMRYPPLGSQEYETETNQAWSKLNKTPYIDYKICIIQVEYEGYDAL